MLLLTSPGKPNITLNIIRTGSGLSFPLPGMFFLSLLAGRLPTTPADIGSSVIFPERPSPELPVHITLSHERQIPFRAGLTFVIQYRVSAPPGFAASYARLLAPQQQGPCLHCPSAHPVPGTVLAHSRCSPSSWWRNW